MRNSGVSGRVFGTPKLDTCHYSWMLLAGFPADGESPEFHWGEKRRHA